MSESILLFDFTPQLGAKFFLFFAKGKYCVVVIIITMQQREIIENINNETNVEFALVIK